jgi:hypothetical protein
MSWFKKKELPELPPLPNEFDESPLEKFPVEKSSIKNELPALPSFPISKMADKISNEALKQAIKEPELKTEDDFEEIDLPPKTKEIPESYKIRNFAVREISKPEPVYVRLDKYQDSLLAFHEIKKKILEIEATIKDIKDIKSKEDLELQEWEEDIRKTKDKIAEIDSFLFQKVE